MLDQHEEAKRPIRNEAKIQIKDLLDLSSDATPRVSKHTTGEAQHNTEHSMDDFLHDISKCTQEKNSEERESI